jgi:uncharacterized repeat protein (TIGR01451 family)
MFKKLISNLPFNPSLIGQLSFYSHRIHAESAVRRTGAIAVVLAMSLQLFAVISPPEQTLAESSQDIIRGGFTSRDQAVAHCKKNTQQFRDILAYYRVDCETLANAKTRNVRSTDYNKQLDSLGRNPRGDTILRTGKVTDEYPVKISGKTYYMGNLWAWDTYSHSTYKVLDMKNLDGKQIMIIYSCGNIVTIGKYAPPAPKPEPKPEPIPPQQTEPEPEPEPEPAPEAPCENLEECLSLRKTAVNHTQALEDANKTTAEASDEITYTLYTTNTSSATINDFIVTENMNDVLDYADITNMYGGEISDDNTISWPATTLLPGQTAENRVSIKVKSPVPQTPASLSDPGHFDLVMTNVYGNAINIELEPGISKTTEIITTTLPKTGPGETVAATVGLTVVVSYFFARTRLIAKELDIVRSDYTISGSM